MKKKKKVDWIIAHDGSQGENAYAFECLRCGQKQRFVVPIAVDIWLAAAKAFEKMHKGCKEQKQTGLARRHCGGLTGL